MCPYIITHIMVNLFQETWWNVCISYHFWTLKCYRYLKSLSSQGQVYHTQIIPYLLMDFSTQVWNLTLVTHSTLSQKGKSYIIIHGYHIIGFSEYYLHTIIIHVRHIIVFFPNNTLVWADNHGLPQGHLLPIMCSDISSHIMVQYQWYESGPLA